MSRFGGFRKGRKRIFQQWDDLKSDNAGSVEAPTTVQELDYTKAKGIWNLRSTMQFPNRGGGGSLGTISYVDLTGSQPGTSSTATVSISASAAAGDLAVLAIALDSSGSTATTPSGWTLVGNGDTSEYPRMYCFAKILDASDISAGSVDVSTSNIASMNLLAIFRAGTISSFTTSNFANDKGSASLSTSLTTTGVAAPTIAIGFLVGRTTQSPTMTWAAADAIVTNTTDGGTRSMGYKLYQDLSLIHI